MTGILKLIVISVIAYFAWKIFFKRRTQLEKSMDEGVALQRLGDVATRTNIAMQPSVSFLGPFPLAAANIDPIYAQPEINTDISFQPTIDGQTQGILRQPVDDFLIKWATGDSSDFRTFGYGPMTAMP